MNKQILYGHLLLITLTSTSYASIKLLEPADTRPTEQSTSDDATDGDSDSQPNQEDQK